MIIDKEIQTYGEKNNVPISLEDTLSFLCQTINKNNCKQVLEIGTAIAYGTITMAENSTAEHFDTVELEKERYDIALQNIKKHNLQNKITAYNMDAEQYLKSCNKKYNLIYLDGPKGQYINYLPYLIKLLETGGIIVADNIYFHGMVTGKIPITKGCRAMIKGLKNYIKAIITHPQLDSKIYEIGDGLGFSIKKGEQ